MMGVKSKSMETQRAREQQGSSQGKVARLYDEEVVDKRRGTSGLTTECATRSVTKSKKIARRGGGVSGLTTGCATRSVTKSKKIARTPRGGGVRAHHRVGDQVSDQQQENCKDRRGGGVRAHHRVGDQVSDQEQENCKDP